MTLSAIILRFGVLVMTKVAIQFRTVMRGGMWIGRFNVLGFLSQFRRASMTGQALFHGQGFRFFGFAVTLFTIDTGELMGMTAR